MSGRLLGYRVTPRAQQDLEEIWLYSLRQWSSAQADSYVSDVLAACQGLVTGEKIGVNAHALRAGYRKYLCGSHSIYYRISGSYLDVIRILHQSRDVDAHLLGE